MKYSRKRIIGSLIPLLAILMFIYIYPLGRVVVSAFYGFTGSTAGKFVGFNNFKMIAPDIPKTVKVTLIWTFGSVIPSMILGLILALICKSIKKGKRGIISANLIPYSIPLIVVASCWRFTYNTDFGFLNVFLKKIGVISESISFLGYDHALASVIVARIWRATPFAFMNYYSALLSIPGDQYEAAWVDGAGPFETFRYITLPNLKQITLSTLLVLTVWTFLVFDIIFGLTGGGPIDATKTISMQIYQEMFSMKNLGTSSAWSLIAIIILVILTVIYWNLMNRG